MYFVFEILHILIAFCSLQNTKYTIRTHCLWAGYITVVVRSICQLLLAVREANVHYWTDRQTEIPYQYRSDIIIIIIISINVLIKVTLNEIRCRGTLQSQW